MSIYFINENPKIKRSAVKKLSLPPDGGSIDIPPISRLSKKQRARLLSAFTAAPAVFFSSEQTEGRLPELFASDSRDFFYRSLPRAIASSAVEFSSHRLILCDATEKQAAYFLSFFPHLYLFGENALSVAAELYFESGASVPIAAEPNAADIVIFFDVLCGAPFFYAFHFDASGDKVFNASSLFYTPKGRYAFISRKLNAPLGINAAARLFSHDPSASFDVSVRQKNLH